MNHPISFPYQFRAADSPIHRLSPGWKLLIMCVMSAFSVAAQSPYALCGLIFLNILYYLLAKLRLADLFADMRFFLIQMMIVIGLYMMRDGITEGFFPGVRTGLKVLLFFIPGAVFIRTTQGSQMIRSLGRIMPSGLAFLVFTSFRFVPVFAREFREIYLAQQLRGAKIKPRQLLNPFNWKDVIHCLMIPLMIRIIKTANEAALSAEARGFGKNKP